MYGTLAYIGFLRRHASRTRCRPALLKQSYLIICLPTKPWMLRFPDACLKSYSTASEESTKTRSKQNGEAVRQICGLGCPYANITSALKLLWRLWGGGTLSAPDLLKKLRLLKETKLGGVQPPLKLIVMSADVQIFTTTWYLCSGQQETGVWSGCLHSPKSTFLAAMEG